jgi:hypothetical protein
VHGNGSLVAAKRRADRCGLKSTICQRVIWRQHFKVHGPAVDQLIDVG